MTAPRIRVTALTPRMDLGPREARHLHVLRLRVGDALRVFDGQGAEAEAWIAELDAGRAVLTLGEALGGAAETPFPLTLAAALLKGDKLSDVVRAATELGVARVQLLVTARADARDIGAQKLLRLQRVAEEASKQSRRAVVPEVRAPLSLADFRWEGQLFVAQPGSASRIMALLDWGAPVTVLTGPEGGLTDAEVAELTGRGAHAVTLGPRILRAETAPVALLGAIAAAGGGED
ncbi:16S rRNA (uracil(1498)-N(3))-methyltransferase [Deinococcus radiopugnans]|uniref:Ribosomal RNA small subunit methyltransferase E n=1 Tax=Deinococcus radiopugnans ATCC 19172 TaxID=585398 RepID=A0A5C4Y979_9DEIO|nr:16S rRNA (uracil(1498)-N(3))-methyltransferase [Deinococcus radiopugnans]MBB6016046.1 16S rRNA (uracil1498-N3)-methyltransferase [Deinococcus radiopugnans ATCC 19172]TNM72080.1 16S rRNA (uracil(1498)-N(3))-methyltransferase [Deinococcus radiopugnans ATCC 19172]